MFRISPSILVRESHSDNLALRADELARPGWLTEISPAVRMDLASANTNGFIDYRLVRSLYPGEPRLDDHQQFLKAHGNFRAMEGHARLDAYANIVPMNRSAFAASVVPDVATPSLNRVEAASYQLSPSVRGYIGDLARYQVRITAGRMRADADRLPAVETAEVAARLGNPSPSAKVGWALETFATHIRSRPFGSLADSRVRASVIHAIDPQMHAYLSGGYEATDYAGPPTRTNATYGAGMEWSPGPRTQLSGVYEKRFFGNSYGVSVSHRRPLTAWRISSSRDAVVLPTEMATSSRRSIQSVMEDLLTSAIPDPEQRAEAVRHRLEDTGISGTSALSANVYTNRPYLLRLESASFALLGATNTVTITLTRRRQIAFGVSLAPEDGAIQENHRQEGFSASFARKLTPLTTLTFNATALRTRGLDNPLLESQQRLYALFFLTRLSPRTSVSIGVRHASFDSSTQFDSYRENLVFAAVSVRL